MDDDEKYKPGAIYTDSDRQSIKDGCWYDADAGQRIIDFAHEFFHVREGRLAGQRLQLLDWQRFVLASLLGWKRKDGRRKYHYAVVFVPARQGKNLVAEILSLYFLVADGEQTPNIICCGDSSKQARHIYDGLQFQIKHTKEDLREALVVKPHEKKLLYPHKDGKLSVATKADKSVFGQSVSLAVIDEIHSWQDPPQLLHTIQSRFGSRTNPLLLMISTVGTNKAAEWYDWYQRAKNIQESVKVQTDFFAFVASADDGCKLDDLDQIKKAQVSLGTATLLSDILDKAKDCEGSLTREMIYRNQWLNQPVGRVSLFLDLDRWMNCRGEVPAPDGGIAFLGCDLAKNTDFTSLVLLAPRAGKYYMRHWNWIPEAALKKQPVNRSLYERFQIEGSLVVTEGDCTDYRLIRAKINELAKEYDIQSIHVERYESTLLTTLLMTEDGFGDKVKEATPSIAWLSDPTKQLENLVLEQKLVWQDGAELLKWQCQNLHVIRDRYGRIKIQNEKAAEHDDTFSALVMALKDAILSEVQIVKTESIYDQAFSAADLWL